MQNTTYKISVKDPKSDNDRKISGSISLIKSNPNLLSGNSILNGLPTPFTNPITNEIVKSVKGIDISLDAFVGSITYQTTPLLGITPDAVLNKVIQTLEDSVANEYGIIIKLSYDVVVSDTTKLIGVTSSISSQSGTTINSIPNYDGVKVTLIKKSGPGELIGINERIVENGYVDFSGIQFDQAGEYILSIITSSDLIENSEVNITVLEEDDIITQDKSRGDDKDDKKVDGTRPIIAQIDKPTIILKPIEFKTTDNEQDNAEIAVGLGFTPFFWYNGYQISSRDIRSLELWYEGLVPRASVVFADSVGLMKKEGMALDDTKFELFLNSGTQNLKSIHLKFKLLSIIENKNGSYTATGTLDLPDFYKIRFKSYKGTSFEVLRQISNELQLGYNSNINNTSDEMNWINNGKLFKDFTDDIIQHSYISDTSYVLGYIDYYYCLNYVDIEKEWLRDISNDVGLISTGVNYLSKSDDSGKIERLVLTNDKSTNSSPLHFSSYKLNNQSTKISVNKGYFTTSKVYDSNSKQFLVFDVDSQTSDGSKTIILKGAPGDNKSITDNYRTQYSGKLDTSNVHKNYYYSETQNRVNLDNMVRISVDLELPNANFNLYKFMKINITFVNERPTVSASEVIESRLTGEWVIIDIAYKWNKGNLKQTVRAVRKELGKTPEELKNDQVAPPVKNVEVNTENNENPITPTADEIKTFKSNATPPNSVYKVGEIYLVNNDSGKQYTITITEISDNGIEVKGIIKNI